MIEPEQRTAAKVAGFLYLFLMVTGVFAEFYARGPLIVPADATQTAKNIVASERLFRIGTVSDLITFAGDVLLVWALYVVLKPINRNLALLAAFWRLAECSILAVITLNDFAALRLLSCADYLRACDTHQLQVLARLFGGLHAGGCRIGVVFFGIGSTVFSYLWFKSRYIPPLSVVIPAYYVPIFIFEVTLGFWLLIKGLSPPNKEKQ